MDEAERVAEAADQAASETTVPPAPAEEIPADLLDMARAAAGTRAGPPEKRPRRVAGDEAAQGRWRKGRAGPLDKRPRRAAGQKAAPGRWRKGRAGPPGMRPRRAAGEKAAPGRWRKGRAGPLGQMLAGPLE